MYDILIVSQQLWKLLTNYFLKKVICAYGTIFNGSETQECHTGATRAAAPANGVLYKNTIMQNSNFCVEVIPLFLGSSTSLDF